MLDHREAGGERAGNRTPNLVVKSHLLCQLSYAPGRKLEAPGCEIKTGSGGIVISTRSRPPLFRPLTTLGPISAAHEEAYSREARIISPSAEPTAALGWHAVLRLR